jgi:hypothetical protein
MLPGFPLAPAHGRTPPLVFPEHVFLGALIVDPAQSANLKRQVEKAEYRNRQRQGGQGPSGD